MSLYLNCTGVALYFSDHLNIEKLFKLSYLLTYCMADIEFLLAKITDSEGHKILTYFGGLSS